MSFAEKLLTWFDQHGRHDLPWQGAGAYAVWLSEIMLQQTQVATVLPYYAKFITRFPTIRALADAPEDEVMAHWAGLGYYNRARNLHRTAQIVRDDYAGEFPHTFDEVLALPGIGRSTAGAILAQAFGQRQAILDGNVKRILARQGLVAGWAGSPKTQKVLWEKAEALLPTDDGVHRMADYTQASMDLGALLCKRRQPLCGKCPVNESCMAFQQGRVDEFPMPKPKQIKPIRQTAMLLCIHNNSVWLHKRPPMGIWPRLWSLPEVDVDVEVNESGEGLPTAIQTWLNQHGLQAKSHTTLSSFRHTFSHYHLDIQPWLLHVSDPEPEAAVHEQDATLWYTIPNDDSAQSDMVKVANIAMPAPVTQLFNQLINQIRQQSLVL